MQHARSETIHFKKRHSYKVQNIQPFRTKMIETKYIQITLHIFKIM